MPRNTQSPESKILHYFKTASLATAKLVLGLVKEVVAERQPKAGVEGTKRHRRTKAEMEAAKVAATPAPAATHKAKPGVKKSHHKAKARKPRHQVPVAAEPAEVEEFDPNV